MSHLKGCPQKLDRSGEGVKAADGRHLELRVGRVFERRDEALHQVVRLDDPLPDVLVVGAERREHPERRSLHVLDLIRREQLLYWVFLFGPLQA